MGRIILYDRNGDDTQVDKTWVLKTPPAWCA
jgi:hypothetical protein